MIFRASFGIGTLACVLAMLLGCSPPQDAAESPQELSVGGVWEVSGLTTEKRSGSQREISGTVVITQEGDAWTSSYNLETSYPTPDGVHDADVIGRGEGIIEGGKMIGTTQTQLVLSTVPGVDTAFAFIPRTIGPRLVSTSIAELADDGALEIVIENQAAEGQSYAATTTSVRGIRVLNQGDKGFPPILSKLSADAEEVE